MQSRSCCIVLPCGCLLPLAVLVVMGVGAVAKGLLEPTPRRGASVVVAQPMPR